MHVYEMYGTECWDIMVDPYRSGDCEDSGVRVVRWCEGTSTGYCYMLDNNNYYIRLLDV